MADIKSIRALLGITQQALADGLGCTQGNVSNYESGQEVPPATARRLITFARAKGLDITFDQIYGLAPLVKPLPEPVGTPGAPVVAERAGG